MADGDRAGMFKATATTHRASCAGFGRGRGRKSLGDHAHYFGKLMKFKERVLGVPHRTARAARGGGSQDIDLDDMRECEVRALSGDVVLRSRARWSCVLVTELIDPPSTACRLAFLRCAAVEGAKPSRRRRSVPSARRRSLRPSLGARFGSHIADDETAKREVRPGTSRSSARERAPSARCLQLKRDRAASTVP